jgi:hypothetical protein
MPQPYQKLSGFVLVYPLVLWADQRLYQGNQFCASWRLGAPDQFGVKGEAGQQRRREPPFDIGGQTPIAAIFP